MISRFMTRLYDERIEAQFRRPSPGYTTYRWGMTTTESGVRTIDGIELTPKTVSLDGPPVFATVEDERLHRKQKLAGALRIFGRVGFGEGVAGHITVRDPEFPEYFWVNPFAVSFRHMRVSDLILVDHEVIVIYGNRP